MEKTLSYKIVWDTLSAVDVSDKAEKKGNLTYLSWAWAWGKLMEHFPQSTYEFTLHEKENGTMSDVLEYADGSVAVECTIRIGELSRTMWLPVMDYKNNAIPQPNSRQISDNKMRCLVKCIGMFGLGHYIYAGEDLPPEVDKPKKKVNSGKAPAKAKPAVIKTELKKEDIDERQSNLKVIKSLIDNDAFDDMNKARITTFVASINEATSDEEIKAWAERMQQVVKTHKEEK